MKLIMVVLILFVSASYGNLSLAKNNAGYLGLNLLKDCSVEKHIAEVTHRSRGIKSTESYSKCIGYVMGASDGITLSGGGDKKSDMREVCSVVAINGLPYQEIIDMVVAHIDTNPSLESQYAFIVVQDTIQNLKSYKQCMTSPDWNIRNRSAS
jgi:hypothetical protein